MGSRSESVDHGLARAIDSFRWLSVGWATVGVILERGHVRHVALAIVALTAMGGMTLAAQWRSTADGSSTDDTRGASRMWVSIEIAVGVAVLLLDGVAFEAGRQQSLPWSWPAAGILAASVGFGVGAGLFAAGVITVGSIAGESILRDQFAVNTATLSKAALYVLAALVAAVVARRLREAERTIAAAEARTEVARVVHDGVLQTLAIVQRRSADPTLQTLAAEQDRDLRAYLAGDLRRMDSFTALLRREVEAVARDHQRPVTCLIASDTPEIDPRRAEKVIGAVREAVTNALKHADATNITVLVEPDDDDLDEIVIAVSDNGTGFDHTIAVEGFGLGRSVRERIAEIGGTVAIESSAGRGTTVRITTR